MLRTGDWTQVETNESHTYAFLRHHEDEAILVLINLGINPVEDYELMLENGILDGAATDSVQAVSLYSQENPATPTLNESGGFAGYQPFASLPPQSSAIIQLIIDN